MGGGKGTLGGTGGPGELGARDSGALTRIVRSGFRFRLDPGGAPHESAESYKQIEIALHLQYVHITLQNIYDRKVCKQQKFNICWSLG